MNGKSPQQGEIYWLDNCEPLAGVASKRRPVVIVSPTKDIRAGAPLVVAAAITTKVLASQRADRVPLPGRQKNPGCSTGLPQECWLVPEWYLVVSRDRLDNADYCGVLSRKLRERVVAAVLEKMTDSNP